MELMAALILIVLFAVLMWFWIFDTSPDSVCDSYPNIGKVVDELGIGNELVNTESVNKIAIHVGYPYEIRPTDLKSDTLEKLEAWIENDHLDRTN